MDATITINGRAVPVEIVVDTTMIAGVVHPTFMSAKVEAGAACEECETDLGESGDLGLEDDEIACEACGAVYAMRRIKP